MPRPAVNVAVRAARAAGTVILRYLTRVEGLAVEEKARHDYVSEVDRLAEAEIVRELRRAYPDHAVLGEESGQTGKSDKVWVVDANMKVYVYNTSGGLLGSWTAGSLASNATASDPF